MIYIVSRVGGFMCPRKIHLNTLPPPPSSDGPLVSTCDCEVTFNIQTLVLGKLFRHDLCFYDCMYKLFFVRRPHSSMSIRPKYGDKMFWGFS